jgi:hypothetical protein
MVRDLNLKVLTVPIELPAMEIAEYWHERYHRDPGHRWIRAAVLELFSQQVQADSAGSR